jgi:hypothetical protein
MYCVIRLARSKDKFVVPKNWIQNFNDAKCLNKGIKMNSKHIVYYSVNKNDEPDFNLNIAKSLQPLPSLYEAHLYRFFGK